MILFEKMRKHFPKIFIIFLLAFGIWIFVAPYLAENLIIEKKLEKANAILVLGGSSTYLERTQKAAELFNAGVSDKVLLTNDGGRGGWDNVNQINPTFAELAKRNLINQGVSPDKIEILNDEVTGTIWEARLLKTIAKERNYKSILLATSAYHTRRSLWTFEKIMAEDNVQIGIESAETGIQTPKPSLWWLSFKGWSSVAGEYVKFVYYWLFI